MTLAAAFRTRLRPFRQGRLRHLPHQPGAPALQVDSLTVRYGGLPALEEVSLRLPRGAQLAVLGPNGAGKSTLLKAIAGVLPPTDGEIRVYGTRPRGHTCIAYLPQRGRVDWSFPLTVADVVGMGRLRGLGLARRWTSQDRARVREGLACVRLLDLADRPIGELSGGQQQKMFIARALAQQAELILMDEPLAGLDVQSQREFLAIIGTLPGAPTLLVSLHELAIARDRFPQVLLLNRKAVAMGTPAEVFSPEALRRAYGATVELIQTHRGTLVVTDSCCPPQGPGPR